MQAPSLLCLRVLRSLAFPSALPTQCLAQHPTRRNLSTSTPPPKQQTPTTAIFRPTPSGPGLRNRREDDDDYTPYPLPRPIGIPHPPQPWDNMGLDPRNLSQRRDDFTDMAKHLQKREMLQKKLFGKPYFRDWSNMKFHKGKVFVAPERLFRREKALWFPNFFGARLVKKEGKREGKDGYGGLGWGTTEVMRGRVSVVSVVSNLWASRDVESFVGREVNPELHALLRSEGGMVQRVEINHDDNWLKWWVLQLFSLGNLRRERSVEEQRRYFMVRRGVTEEMKEAIGILNDKGGYVYLVDGECKIRWAGSATAWEGERESLVRGVRKLVEEAKMPVGERERREREKEKLVDVVGELVEEPPPR